MTSTGLNAMWGGFVIFFLAAIWFQCRADRYEEMYKTLEKEGFVTGFDENYFSKYPSTLVTIACTITSVAYLIMATGHGSYLQCCTGRSISAVRYVSWLMTSPLLLLAALQFALRLPHHVFIGTWGARDRTNWVNDQNNLVTLLIVLDLLMIIAGYIGSNICGPLKWAFWGFGVLCFIPLLHFLCSLNRGTDACCRGFLGRFTSPMDAPFTAQIRRRAHYYNLLTLLLVLSWMFYPLVWLAASGTRALSADGEALAYLGLDFVSKIVFGYIASHTYLGPFVPVPA